MVAFEAVAEATPTASGFVYGAQQREAFEAVQRWWCGEDAWESPIFKLFGFAGTGKTSSAKAIVADLGVEDASFAAFTGKAAHVLRSKGCPATTIHSLIYKPYDKAIEELQRLRIELADETDPSERARLMREIRDEEINLGKPGWVLNAESDLAGSQLLVLDEASMVNADMAHDLLSFGARIIVLGDPAQLPPVSGAGYFTSGEPDYLLTEVHRTAAEQPTTKIATAVRNAPVGDRLLGVRGAVGDSGRCGPLSVAAMADYDQVVVGTNRIRWQLIRAIRMHLRRPPMPVAGDRIITLANSREANVFNGQQFTVMACKADGKRYVMQVLDGDFERQLTAHQGGFTNLDGEQAAVKNGRGPVAAATFAQAITCHKSQGSEWPRVLVVDEADVFGSGRYKDAMRDGASPTQATEASYAVARSWLYTAVTRAQQQVSIVSKGSLRLA
jgi:exodeoxyribonuclease V